MDRVKEYLALFFGGRLFVEGSGRTFARLPVWLAALAAVSSLRLAAVTVLLIVAFGMKVRVAKA
ncbi:MAG: hypothetical protein IKJ11_00335 [Clostridia bacterium]|nr:hypothetical protein [Clostridia bacterium]